MPTYERTRRSPSKGRGGQCTNIGGMVLFISYVSKFKEKIICNLHVTTMGKKSGAKIGMPVFKWESVFDQGRGSSYCVVHSHTLWPKGNHGTDLPTCRQIQLGEKNRHNRRTRWKRDDRNKVGDGEVSSRIGTEKNGHRDISTATLRAKQQGSPRRCGGGELAGEGCSGRNKFQISEAFQVTRTRKPKHCAWPCRRGKTTEGRAKREKNRRRER